MKKILAKVLAGPIKIYNKIKIKRYYQYLDIKASQLGELGKVLVLVPHVDDEVIGLGGLLAGLDEESKLHLLYGTDSGASKGNMGREEISRTRFLEAESLAKELDIEIVGKMLELKNKDENWSFNIFKDYLESVLNSNDYDSIFTVSMVDAHSEHRRLTCFLGRFLKDFDYNGDIYLYEVSNLLPNDWINKYIL